MIARCSLSLILLLDLLLFERNINFEQRNSERTIKKIQNKTVDAYLPLVHKAGTEPLLREASHSNNAFGKHSTYISTAISKTDAGHRSNDGGL